MNILSALLFAVSADIDVFLIGLSYGIKKQRIPLPANLCISSITFAGTLIAILAGSSLAAFVPQRAAVIAGSALLILLGLYYCLKYLVTAYPKRRDCPKAVSDLSAAVRQEALSMSRKDMLFLGLALAVNNAAMGIGASFGGIPILLTSSLTLLLAMLFLALGNGLGTRWAPACLQTCGDLCSGIIIIFLGFVSLV